VVTSSWRGAKGPERSEEDLAREYDRGGNVKGGGKIRTRKKKYICRVGHKILAEKWVSECHGWISPKGEREGASQTSRRRKRRSETSIKKGELEV